MIANHAVCRRVKKYTLNKWFLIVLGVKIVFSFLFANSVLTKGFAPFINYFVESGFSNPYDYFLGQGMLKAFPYSTVMLWILAIPRAIFSFFLNADWHVVNALNLFVTRIPVLFADIVIYLVLCFWLPVRENKVRIFYWASPILFYINYFHGQLDAIPTALLFVSLAMLFMRREWLAFIFLGVGMAAKTHLIAALPFYLLYVYVKKTPKLKIGAYCLAAMAVFAALLLPYFFSDGYQQLVIHAAEQGWVFNLSIPYGDLSLFIVPMVYLLLFLRFSFYQKITQDFFIVALGVVFTILVIFVPPMPGWFYWSVPFLAYFYINKKEASSLNFWFFNAFFLFYFLLSDKSDIFSAFQIISPKIATLQTPFDFFRNLGLNAVLFKNLLFTAMETSIVMNVFYCYKIGIRDNFVYKAKTKPLLIGIGGDSGSGKTTLSKVLAKLFNEKNVVNVCGDDTHKWPRGHKNWQVFTHLDPRGNQLHRDLDNAIALKSGYPIERVHYDHTTGQFTDPVIVEPNKVIIFEGLHPFYIKQARDLFDLKIFLKPEESLRRHWKTLRDTAERGYSKDKVDAEFEKRHVDSEKYIQPQEELADITISQTSSGQLQIIIDNSIDVESFVQNFNKIDTFKINYSYEHDDKIIIECAGGISEDEVEKCAYELIPGFQEITQAKPEFDGGAYGIIQLFVIYYLGEISKFEEKSSIL